MKPIIFILSLSSMLCVGCATNPTPSQLNVHAGHLYFLQEPQGNKIKYPIVLAHGFNASPTSLWGFNKELIEALKKDHGDRVFTTQVSPFNSVRKRAEELKLEIDKILICTRSEKVNIIAHSMGGLDARYLVSRLNYKDHVASITTISTPHWGTKIADDFHAPVGKIPKHAVAVITNGIGQVTLDSCENKDCDLSAALSDMSENANNQFNQNTPDVVHGMLYQSYAGVSGHSLDEAVRQKTKKECQIKMLMGEGMHDVMQPLLIPIEISVSHGHGNNFRPNDGVVTVQSAIWGNFLGCIPADHLAEVGQINANKDKPNAGTDFNYIRFYRTLAFNLAKQGY